MARLRPLLLPVTALAALSTQNVHADAVGVNVGVFNGIALEYYKTFSPKLNARLALTTLPADVDLDEDDIEYKAEIDKDNFGVLLDWHPFSGGFRVSGGLYLGNHEWKISAKANDGTYEIGDNTYESNDLKLKGSIAFNDATPYLGIGWGNTNSNNGLAMTFDLGLLAVGEGDVSYTASGTVELQGSGIPLDVNNDPVFQANLEKERQQLEDDIEDFKLMPVISLGMVYAF